MHVTLTEAFPSRASESWRAGVPGTFVQQLCQCRRVENKGRGEGRHGAYYTSTLLRTTYVKRAPAKITTRWNDKSFTPHMHAYPGRHKAFGQPRLLKLRIGYAHRNHSDYQTRITMQMLVNSHVPVHLQDRCVKPFPPAFLFLTDPLVRVGTWCASCFSLYIRKKKTGSPGEEDWSNWRGSISWVI